MTDITPNLVKEVGEHIKANVQAWERALEPKSDAKALIALATISVAAVGAIIGTAWVTARNSWLTKERIKEAFMEHKREVTGKFE